MDNHDGNSGFQYTYSAREQAELKRIRDKYTGKEEDALERLRRLDAGVTQKAQTVSLIFGVIGALILGFGMSLVMSDLGEGLGWNGGLRLPLGILIGVAGGVLAGIAYPMYHFVLRRERARIAPEIIRLTDELLK